MKYFNQLFNYLIKKTNKEKNDERRNRTIILSTR
jgi:hypothetical protein